MPARPPAEKGGKTRRYRLVYALFLSFFLVGTVPLILSAWKFAAFNREWLGRNQRLIQLQIGRHVSDEIDNYLQAGTRDVWLIAELLAGNQTAAQFRTQISSPDFDAFLKKLISRGPFSEIQVLDAGGSGLRVSLGEMSSGLEVVLREAFHNALNQPELIVSLALEEANGRSVVFARRVYLGQTLGVVLAVASLEPLAEKIAELGVEDEFLVTDLQGRVILSNQVTKKPLEPQLLREIEKLKGQVGRNIAYVSEDTHERKIATLMRTPSLDWFVIVRADEAVTYYPVRQVINSTLLWLAVALVLAGAFGLLVSGWISKPIGQLVKGSKSLASGNFQERVQVGVKNEVGELAEHFNSMADHIEHYVEELRSAVQSNRQLFLQAVQTIAAAIDEKDPYTKGHSERVTYYAVKVGEELGLSSEEVENLRVAALLHDVGKIGIPDQLLQKPVALNPEEFEIMKQHPVKGARIIGQISQLQEVIPGILHHHEKVDGTGYPDGLQSSRIPIQARIISVVDAFDALTTQRPYQSPIGPEPALKRIESFVGTRYDALVVDALKAALCSGRLVLRQ